MKKNYIVDTNVLLDNPDCIKILRMVKKMKYIYHI